MKLSRNVKTIFITGGAGFIGSHLVDMLLKQKNKVIVFDNFSSGKVDFIKHNLKNKNFHLVKGDLLSKSDLKKAVTPQIDMIYHLAANPDISKGIEDPKLDFNQTIIATFNLLLTMKEQQIKKLVYFSGSGVYGDVGKTYTAEDFGPLLPVSMYGASKLSAEALISAFSNLFGIQSWIFRPANIIGKRATHGVIFDFINKLRKDYKNLLILGDGFQSKSYLHISDVLDSVILAIEKTNDLINLFNIASETYITVNEIADIILKKINFSNVNITHTKGKIGWPGDVPIVRINNKKLKELGWSPKFSSKQAVEKTINEILDS